MFDVIALKSIMAAQGVSIAALAKASGVSYVALTRILNAGTTPNLTTIGRLAAALGVSPKELFKA